MSKINNKKPNWPILGFIIFSFIVMPAIALPLLIINDLIERFSYLLAGYWAIATQIIALNFKEARIWKLHLFDYDNDKSSNRHIGRWLNIFILVVGIIIFCYGIYHLVTI